MPMLGMPYIMQHLKVAKSQKVFSVWSHLPNTQTKSLSTKARSPEASAYTKTWWLKLV